MDANTTSPIWSGVLFLAPEPLKPFWRKLALVKVIMKVMEIMDAFEKFALEFNYLKMLLGRFVRKNMLKVFYFDFLNLRIYF